MPKLKDQQTAQREIVLRWFQIALDTLETGEEIYIPCHTREQTKEMLKTFRKELRIFEKVDPISAASISIFRVYKDNRFWVVLKKTTPEISTGFKKDIHGNVSKMSLDADESKRRRISLMREDGMSWEEIEKEEGPLTEEEKNEM